MTQSKKYRGWYKEGKSTLVHESGNAKVSIESRHPYVRQQSVRYNIFVNGSWLCDYRGGPITGFTILDNAIKKAEKIMQESQTKNSTTEIEARILNASVAERSRQKVNLTENEVKILKASRTNNFCDAFLGDSPWVFAVIEASGLDPKIARGVISSLAKKDLVIVDDYEGKGRADDMTFSLTSDGIKAVVDYGITDEEDVP